MALTQKLLCLCCISFLFLGTSGAVEVLVVQSSNTTADQLTPKAPIQFTAQKGSGDVIIRINSTQQYQKILGFGGAFTEAGASVYAEMSPDLQKQVMEAYFGDDGLQYSVCRTHINSCDFCIASYNFDNVTDDFELKNFDIQHDLKWLIPFIKDALQTSNRHIHLFASPWSPPAWMKGNGQMDGSSVPGLKGDNKYHATWALYYSKYISAYANEGINIWGLTVQNEPEFAAPWEACVYNPDDEREFIKTYLGPQLARDHPGVVLMIYDHNKDHIVDWVQTIYSDPDAAKYVQGTGFHWYSGPQFDNVQKAHDLFPDKFLLATEACNCPPSIGNWNNGEKYAYDIIGDLNSWAVGWTDWNMLLNTQGGPNHLQGYCDASFLYDHDSGKLIVQSTYYYMGQISKFILPNSYRIRCDVSKPVVQAVAVVTPSNQVVVVALNMNDYTVNMQLENGGMYAPYAMPAHSIVTFSFPQF